MIMIPRQNKKYEATKKAMLIDIARYKIRINNYKVYGVDLEKIIKDIINRLGD